MLKKELEEYIKELEEQVEREWKSRTYWVNQHQKDKRILFNRQAYESTVTRWCEQKIILKTLQEIIEKQG